MNLKAVRKKGRVADDVPRARQVKIRPSCGCVFCDLGMPRTPKGDGWFFHDLVEHGVRDCPIEPLPAPPGSLSGGVRE